MNVISLVNSEYKNNKICVPLSFTYTGLNSLIVSTLIINQFNKQWPLPLLPWSQFCIAMTSPWQQQSGHDITLGYITSYNPKTVLLMFNNNLIITNQKIHLTLIFSKISFFLSTVCYKTSIKYFYTWECQILKLIPFES